MGCLTKIQVDLLIREIDMLIDSLYQTNPHFDVREETLRELDLRKLREPDTHKLLSDWKIEIECLKVLKLELAFEPNPKALQKIWQWASLNITPDIVLEITSDPKLVAGAIIAWNGKYKDYSDKNKFVNDVFATVWKALPNS